MKTQKREHWRKVVHTDYLAGDEIVDENGKQIDITVTIKGIVEKEVVNPRTGIKELKGILILEGIKKGIILNITNGKSISKVLNSVIWADWISKQIIIYGQSDKVHGYVVRVRPMRPQPKPELTPTSDKWETARTKVKEGMTFKELSKHYTITETNFKTLTQ